MLISGGLADFMAAILMLGQTLMFIYLADTNFEMKEEIRKLAQFDQINQSLAFNSNDSSKNKYSESSSVSLS